MTNKRHPLAALIHAYAEGAQIQRQCENGEWVDTFEPVWWSCTEYRIKPEIDWVAEFRAGKVIQRLSITNENHWSTVVDADTINPERYEYRYLPEKYAQIYDAWKHGAQLEHRHHTFAGWSPTPGFTEDVIVFSDQFDVRLKSKPHVHAELMKLYAEDAAETETPWERWEFCEIGQEGWSGWHTCTGGPGWAAGYKYRRKESK